MDKVKSFELILNKKKYNFSIIQNGQENIFRMHISKKKCIIKIKEDPDTASLIIMHILISEIKIVILKNSYNFLKY